MSTSALEISLLLGSHLAGSHLGNRPIRLRPLFGGTVSSPNVHSSSGLPFAFSKACRHTQVGNQAGNSLQITIRGESGEGRAQGASWPPESGWGQAMLLGRAGGGRQGKTNGHTRDMQEAQACVGGGAACGVGGGQQHEQYPAGGPGWAPGPHGRIHPTLLPFACLGLALPPPRHICLAPSWLASLPVSAPLLWGRSSAAPFSRS